MKRTKKPGPQRRAANGRKAREGPPDVPVFQVRNLLNFLNCVERPEDITAVVELPGPETARRITQDILASRADAGSLCTLGEVAALPSMDRLTLNLFLDAARHAIVPTPCLTTFESAAACTLPLAQPLLISTSETVPLIIACLVNGIRCGTNFYRLAVEKLDFLRRQRRDKVAEREDKKRRRDNSIAGGGTPVTLEGDIARLDQEIDAIDREVGDILGKNLHDAWAKLRANLTKKSDRLEMEINDASKAGDAATAQAKSVEKKKVDDDIVKLDMEEPPK